MAEAAMTRWTPRSAWDGVLSPGRIGGAGEAGVSITPRSGLVLTSVLVSREGRAALAASIAQAGGTLPDAGRASRFGDHALLWSGPEAWLLVSRDRAALAALTRSLGGVSALSDQSDGRAVLRVSGPRARDALAKGCMIDLHPSAFPKDAVASTSIAYVGVQIWRPGDAEDAFEIFVPRSMAGSFWSWLSSSAAEFGCDVAPIPAPMDA
jgi:heterotetrameric sarcosine oxidase gamma subunit